ncbi:MAG: TolC family protein [Myxococcota bacterium]
MFWLLIPALWARPLTFDEALDHALAENLELAQQRIGNTLVRHRLNTARAGFDPRLVAGVSADQNKTPSNAVTDVGGAQPVITSSGTSWNVGVSQALPTGGSLSAGVSEFQSNTDSANALSARFVASRANVSVSQPLLRGAGFGALADLRDAHLDLAAQEIVWQSQLEATILALSDAYWGLLSARERLAIAERGVELAEEQLAETRERLDAGFAGSGDVLQVQVLVGEASRSLVVARASVGSAEDRLARLLGMPVREGAGLELSDRPEVPTELPDRDVVLATARDRNAAFGLARIQLERARRATRRSRNGALPDVDLQANASWSAGGEDPGQVRSDLLTSPAPSYGVGVNVALPLVPRETRAAFGMAKLTLDQAELAFQAAEQDLELQVADAVRALDADAAGLQAARQTLEHAKLSLDAQRELLGEGRGSTRDVVDALESLRGAEAAELDARIALQLSVLRAEALAGTLVSVDTL